jgi:hypothetical protein
MPKRRASWVSLISLFMPPLAIAVVAVAAALPLSLVSFFAGKKEEGLPIFMSGLDI